MRGLTLGEKILHRHAVRAAGPPRPGQVVQLRPRHLLTHDNTAAILEQFRALGVPLVRYPWQPVIALDHDVQNTAPERLAEWVRLEEFARAQRLDFHRAGSGIGHQIMVEDGYVLPGALCVAADSHANMYGALGALGLAVVRSDAAAIWATGEFTMEVPEAVRVEFTGQLADGVTGKDLALALCARFDAGEVRDAIVEFTGDGVAALSMDDRLTVSNMTTEWGAAAGIFPVDAATLAWLEEVRRSLARRGLRRLRRSSLERWAEDPPRADPDAFYSGEIVVDLGSVGPRVHGPASVAAVADRPEELKIDKAFLVGCANARLEDLRRAAAELRGGAVHEGVQFYVSAASRAVQDEAVRDGTWGTLVAAGARTLPPGCAMCIGLGEGILADGEVAISATNRNFPGRMGAPSGRAWLASPATVARAAREGRVRVAPPRPLVASSRRAPPPAPAPAAELVAGFPARIEGRAIRVAGDGLDTDRIYPSTATYRQLPPADMAAHLFENHDPRLAAALGGVEVLVAGRRFGSGSSREQAVTALLAAGIRVVVAASLGRHFRRNAKNQALLCVEVPGLETVVAPVDEAFTILDAPVVVDFAAQQLRIDAREFAFRRPDRPVQELWLAGGLIPRLAGRFAGRQESA